MDEVEELRTRVQSGQKSTVWSPELRRLRTALRKDRARKGYEDYARLLGMSKTVFIIPLTGFEGYRQRAAALKSLVDS